MAVSTFERNVVLDAALVKASVEGGFDKFMFAVRSLGLLPDEAVARAEWLKKQGAGYIRKVAERVVELEKEIGA